MRISAIRTINQLAQYQSGADLRKFSPYMPFLLQHALLKGADDEATASRARQEALRALCTMVLSVGAAGNDTWVGRIVHAVLSNLDEDMGDVEASVSRTARHPVGDDEDDEEATVGHLAARGLQAIADSCSGGGAAGTVLDHILLFMDDREWRPVGFAVEVLRPFVTQRHRSSFRSPVFLHMLRHFSDPSAAAARRAASGEGDGEAERRKKAWKQPTVSARARMLSAISSILSMVRSISMTWVEEALREHLLPVLAAAAEDSKLPEPAGSDDDDDDDDDDAGDGDSDGEEKSAKDSKTAEDDEIDVEDDSIDAHARLSASVTRCIIAMAVQLPSYHAKVEVISAILSFMHRRSDGSRPAKRTLLRLAFLRVVLRVLQRASVTPPSAASLLLPSGLVSQSLDSSARVRRMLQRVTLALLQLRDAEDDGSGRKELMKRASFTGAMRRNSLRLRAEDDHQLLHAMLAALLLRSSATGQPTASRISQALAMELVKCGHHELPRALPLLLLLQDHALHRTTALHAMFGSCKPQTTAAILTVLLNFLLQVAVRYRSQALRCYVESAVMRMNASVPPRFAVQLAPGSTRLRIVGTDAIVPASADAEGGKVGVAEDSAASVDVLSKSLTEEDAVSLKTISVTVPGPPTARSDSSGGASPSWKSALELIPPTGALSVDSITTYLVEKQGFPLAGTKQLVAEVLRTGGFELSRHSADFYDRFLPAFRAHIVDVLKELRAVDLSAFAVAEEGEEKKEEEEEKEEEGEAKPAGSGDAVDADDDADDDDADDDAVVVVNGRIVQALLLDCTHLRSRVATVEVDAYIASLCVHYDTSALDKLRVKYSGGSTPGRRLLRSSSMTRRFSADSGSGTPFGSPSREDAASADGDGDAPSASTARRGSRDSGASRPARLKPRHRRSISEGSEFLESVEAVQADVGLRLPEEAAGDDALHEETGFNTLAAAATSRLSHTLTGLNNLHASLSAVESTLQLKDALATLDDGSAHSRAPPSLSLW
eukprot:PLAT12535.4.p1 GENE.PLAT12535.4~~PLAT12535.4.p1  ORF type:complete len:1002 (+),score=511.57 PLAT12535.4:165-3170(+)